MPEAEDQASAAPLMAARRFKIVKPISRTRRTPTGIVVAIRAAPRRAGIGQRRPAEEPGQQPVERLVSEAHETFVIAIVEGGVTQIRRPL